MLVTEELRESISEVPAIFAAVVFAIVTPVFVGLLANKIIANWELYIENIVFGFASLFGKPVELAVKCFQKISTFCSKFKDIVSK